MIQLTVLRTGEIQSELGQIIGQLEKLQVEVPPDYIIAKSNLSVAIDGLQKVLGHLIAR